jgi:hypothetical protein
MGGEGLWVQNFKTGIKAYSVSLSLHFYKPGGKVLVVVNNNSWDLTSSARECKQRKLKEWF